VLQIRAAARDDSGEKSSMDVVHRLCGAVVDSA
jgi:hypothetical protein